jgi:hypothetical protein
MKALAFYNDWYYESTEIIILSLRFDENNLQE